MNVFHVIIPGNKEFIQWRRDSLTQAELVVEKSQTCDFVAMQVESYGDEVAIVPSNSIVIAITFAICIFFNSMVYAHGIGPRGVKRLDWHTEQISQVNSLIPIHVHGNTRTEKIEGKTCMIAPALEIDVLNDYAYDIDESVELEILFDLENSGPSVVLQYDKNGQVSAKEKFTLPDQLTDRWYRHTFTLERARFAGRAGWWSSGFKSVDFSISTPWEWQDRSYVSVCGIILKRSYVTPQPDEFGEVALELVDESGKPVLSRVGIYDATGRTPLPEKEALPVTHFSDISRTVALRLGGMPWPEQNRFAFYVDGSYRARLPVGKYKLIVARGLEYKIIQKTFEIKSEKETFLPIKLSRWIDMADNGWYSGEVHIHRRRVDVQDDLNIRRLIQAENLNVANLLQMGNIGAVHFQQNIDWKKRARFGEAPYSLVSGQEDPRTYRRGHTIQLNIEEPLRNPKRYYLYHELFEAVHKQGGLTGYAHVRSAFNIGAHVGLAMDVPFGLVDFVELMPVIDDVKIWFDFLNLGYKLSPAAGTDYPYGYLPGTVRNYVKVRKPYSVQGWFDGLKAGRTFVTNGPMLEFNINGQSMGSDIWVTKGEILSIEGSAVISQDFTQIDKLELFKLGKIIASTSSKDGSGEIYLNYELPAGQGAWFVLKAYGQSKNQYEHVTAYSAPIYVYVNGAGFCDPGAVPSIVADLKRQLQEMIASTVVEQIDSEQWDTWEPRRKYWPQNKVLLQKRIVQVNKKYDEIVELADTGRCHKE